MSWNKVKFKNDNSNTLAIRTCKIKVWKCLDLVCAVSLNKRSIDHICKQCLYEVCWS